MESRLQSEYGGRHQKSWTCQDKGPGRAECLAYFQISWITSLFFILISTSALYNSDVVYIYEVHIYEVYICEVYI